MGRILCSTRRRAKLVLLFRRARLEDHFGNAPVWQELQSLVMMLLLPSTVLCLPSWQRKQPAQQLMCISSLPVAFLSQSFCELSPILPQIIQLAYGGVREPTEPHSAGDCLQSVVDGASKDVCF